MTKERSFIERLRSFGRFYIVPVTEHSEYYLARWLRESNYKFSIPILPGETLDQAMARTAATPEPRVELHGDWAYINDEIYVKATSQDEPSAPQGRQVRPHRSGGGPGYFADERLQRIDNLMNAERGTPEGAELDKLVDEQMKAEKTSLCGRVQRIWRGLRTKP